MNIVQRAKQLDSTIEAIRFDGEKFEIIIKKESGELEEVGLVAFRENPELYYILEKIESELSYEE